MDGKRVFGGVLVLLGVAFLFYGINDLNSVSSKLMRLVGQTNTGAYIAIFGGVVAGIAGLALLFQRHDTL
jgi:hypothetical protein